MSNVIYLAEKRSKKKSDPTRKNVPLQRPEPIVARRINSALNLFGALLFLVNRRQKTLLAEIWLRYYLDRRPIEVREMAELMISYISENKKYLEKKTGTSMTVDFNDKREVKKLLKRIELARPKMWYYAD